MFTASKNIKEIDKFVRDKSEHLMPYVHNSFSKWIFMQIIIFVKKLTHKL